jgi:DNA-binding transcriptional LysR family regulator
MGVSHAAVWQQVRALERQFGVALLKREGRNWRPTDDGNALVDLISGILHSIDELDDAFRRLRGEMPRTLKLIASAGAAVGELARPLADFRRLVPNCRVDIEISGSLEQTMDKLLVGGADLAVVPQSLAGQFPARKSIRRQILCERPAVIAVKANDSLARKRRIGLEDLIDIPILIPSRDFAWRLSVDEVFRRAGLLDQLNVTIELGLTQSLQRCVLEGLGTAMFPRTNDELVFPGVTLRQVDHLFPAENVLMLSSHGTRPEVRQFEELLRKHHAAG